MTYIPQTGATTSGLVFSDSPNLDAFGRLRTSDPFTIFDNKQLYDKQSLYWSEQIVNNSGSVSSTHSSLKAATTMTLGTSSGDAILRRTKQYFNYQAGKSQEILMTFRMGAAVANCTKRIGLFDDSNGIFLEQDSSGVLNLVIRTNTSGTPTETKIPQSSWNVDKLDGTGESGITLDISKTQILIIDFEWLGVGRVRFGFVIGGNIYYTHYVINANAIETVYISKPNLPLSYQIVNTGATASQPSMDHICTTIFSEGGFNPIGTAFSASTENQQTNVDSNYRHIISLRKKTGLNTITIKIEQIGLLSTTANLQWILVLNPTNAPSTFTSFASESAVEVNTTSTNDVTGGTVVSSGFMSNNQDTININFDSNLNLGQAIDGTRDIFVLAARSLGSDENVWGSLTWRELG